MWSLIFTSSNEHQAESDSLRFSFLQTHYTRFRFRFENKHLNSQIDSFSALNFFSKHTHCKHHELLLMCVLSFGFYFEK